jgi:hypothetical protein
MWNLIGFRGKRPGRRPEWQRPRLLLEELESRLAPSATTVLQYHNDNSNTGQNLSETSLTPANVNSGSFGKLFSTSVDGQVYAQPLVMTGVNITTGTQQGTHDVVFVATEHDSLYAIDANTGSVLWHDALLPSKYGGTVTTVPDGDVNGAGDLAPEIGITATPVIDPSTNTIYVEEKTKEVTGGNRHYLHWLQALDVGSGAAKFGGPVLIADSIADSIGETYVSGPTVNGSYVQNPSGAPNPIGAPSGQVPFDSLRQMDRPGLTLANGNVYLAYGSHSDNDPYHGWVLGYSASTLAPTAVFNTTPNGSRGGIWQGGTALAVDASGNLYLETGNGTFDTTLNSSGFPVGGDFGDSFVKLAVDPSSSASNQNGNLNGWGLKATDYFTPFNQAGLDNLDADLGSGGPFLLPDSAGSAAHPHLLVGSGKEGRIYLIDRDNMGHFDPSTDHVVQELPAVTISASFGTGAYFNGQIYYVGGNYLGWRGNPDDVAKTFSIAGAQLSTSPTSEGPDTYAYPGNSPSISANGSANGILWAVDKGSNQLRAYNPANLATELYTSAQAANNRDALGTAIKFAVPTVANGHVYVGTGSALVGYGLLTQATQAPAAPSNLSATASSGTVINLSWQDNDTAPNSATGYDIEDSTNGTTFTQVGTASAGATSFSVGGLQTSTTSTFRVRAFNDVGDSAYSNTASATTLSQTGGLSATTTALSASPSAATFGQPLALTATVTPSPATPGTVPTGTVTFFNGATPLGTAAVNALGVASLSVTAQPTGTLSLSAVYSGDGNFAGSASAATALVVQPDATTTALTAAPSPDVFGQALALSATVSPAGTPGTVPTGTVTFLNGATPLGTAAVNASGVATLTLAAQPTGTLSLTAVYSGDGNFTGSTSAAVPLTVQPLGTTTALSSVSPSPAVFGQPLTLTATVTFPGPAPASPTGTVSFITGATSLGGAPLAGGVATLTLAAQPLGDLSLTAAYSGDGNFAGSTSAAVPLSVFGEDTVGVFDPSTGTWDLRNEADAGPPDAGQFAYGFPGWIGLVGDWNGDGVSTIAVVDPTTATWYIRNSNSAGAPDYTPFQYGLPGWIPVAGDWAGTGHTGIGMFDPSTGNWYLRDSASPGPVDFPVFAYGAPGWVPVAGDWAGTGHAGIGVYDPSTGNWYLRNEVSAGAPDAGQFAYGGVGFNPVVGDWNGDGKVTIGVFDSGGNWLLRNSNSAGPPDITPFHYGLLNWTPVSGNWGPPAATPTAAPSARAAEAVDPGLAPLSAEALGLSGADLDLLASSPATARRNQENTSG